MLCLPKIFLSNALDKRKEIMKKNSNNVNFTRLSKTHAGG